MFDFTENRPVAFNDELPKEVDVVIIGGGVIGISTAWYLLKRGHSVLVCEKGRIAGEQSSRNWGWIRVTGRDPDEVPIAIESLSRWKEIDQEISEEMGFLENQGVLALSESERELEDLSDWADLAKTYDLDTRMLSHKEISSLIPAASGDWKGGIITPSDARAEPFRAVPAIARAVQALGGLIRENCAVRTIESQAGQISAVVTEAGLVKTNSVLCAAGGWSSLFLSNFGISLPQLVVQGTVARTDKAPSIYDGAAGLQDVFLRRRQDGGYTVATGMTSHIIGVSSFRNLFKFLPSLKSASDIRVKLGIDPTQQSLPKKKWTGDQTSLFEKHRVLNPVPEDAAIRKMRKNFDKRLPALAGTKFVQSWSGMIDATPDVVPVMDQVSDMPGLFLATGFSGHGFGIGPGAGRVMADLICGNPPGHDLTRFRYSRFFDGSKMRPGPAI